MTKKLVLIRHGEASYPDKGGDFSRALTELGKEQNSFIANKILEKDCCPEILISSNANRAVQTAQQFAKIWGIEKNKIVERSEIYESTTLELLKLVNQMNDQFNHAVIFGHNPGLSDLAEYFTGFNFQLNTSSALVLEFESSSWSEISKGTGKIILYLEP